MVETKTRKRFKCLHSNNGGEDLAKSFQDFCGTKGIKWELVAPYNPPHNGVIDCMCQRI